jgi:hypothetical protein
VHRNFWVFVYFVGEQGGLEVLFVVAVVLFDPIVGDGRD